MATNVNTQIYDKILDRAAMIRLYERRVNGKIGLVFDGHESRLNDIVLNSNLSTKGKQKLFKDIDDELLKTFQDTYKESKRSLLDLFTDQASYAYQNIEVAMGKIWKTERPQTRLAEDVVLKRPLYQDRTLSAGWGGISIGTKKRLEAVIRKGIADNQSIDEIALAIRKGNVHNITRYQSKSLVVTAVTSVAAQADHSIYEANKKAINGYQYVAVLDSRTSEICAHRDGRIYPVGDVSHLPPAHFNCRSTTVPVFKSWDDISKLEGVAQVRKRNVASLSKDQLAFYDGQTPLRESYQEWLKRQPRELQLRHLGDYQKVDLFNSGQLTLDKFTNPEGNTIGIKELRALSDSSYTLPNDTKRFAMAKEKLDAMQLGASTPEDFYSDAKLVNTLRDYYLLQAGELDGTLSLTNFRGALLGTKRNARKRVLTAPPTEDQMKFNPITKRYEDIRLYQPNSSVYSNNIRLIEESDKLTSEDKKFITSFLDSLNNRMSLNERAVVADNLRIIFGRYRENKEVWTNFKAVVQGQIKFDVMNVSDAIETQIRKDSNLLKKLSQDNYIDPVLGTTQLDDLNKNFIPNILAKNNWEDSVAPKLALELRETFDRTILKKSPLIWKRLTDTELQQFYLKFANRLGLADTPDKDQLAVALGRDLYNLANLNGNRKEWFDLGTAILETSSAKKFYEIETFGVQKRRMKSRLSGQYFGPYYDTLSYNIRVTDPRIQDYAQLTRKVELGLRVSVTNDKNRLIFREGYKTYFIDRGILGYEDTRIPITSTSSFSDFPEEFVDKDLVNALNWAAKTKYKIDEDFYDFTQKLLYFEDDRGKAKYYNDLNEYKKYISSRGDAYERFKAMDWLRKSGNSFSNHPFVDHRARIYDRGLIGPQSGETFRPFLNTAEEKNFSPENFRNFQDQIGSFLGGLNDNFEGRYNSLSITGRQKIAERLRPELVKIGNQMLRGKPNDIRAILENEALHQVDGEDMGKFLRFAIETAKIDNYLVSKAKSGMPLTKVTESLLNERKDVAGLIKLLDVNIKSDPKYIGTIDEILQSQAEIIELASTGKISKNKLEKAVSWLHTDDIELTKERFERATYKTYDHKTGNVLSAEEIAANKRKFLERSKGNTDQYISWQIVEELGEFFEEHLRSLGVSSKNKIYITIEAQKRALKVNRFGADTIIKDESSIYFGKTNREAASAAAKAAGISNAEKLSIEDITASLNAKMTDQVKDIFRTIATDPYSKKNLENLRGYRTALALEQDASSSGAQIIALTTRNKQLAELSNVVPTNQKRRLYDEIAAATYNDPRFKEINKKFGLSEKDLRKAAKAQNMVTFYGAGERTGVLNVEGKLSKVLEKDGNTLVVKASDRDIVLNEISAQIAKYERFDPETALELRQLRQNVKDIFNKGLDPGDEIMDQLYFLQPQTKDLVEKMSLSYERVVTPNDFKAIASIMSEYLSEQVPVLKYFTKYFGRLAEDYLANAKPSNADFDWVKITKLALRGNRDKGYILPDYISRTVGIKANEPVREKLLKRFGWWNPNSNLADILLGVKSNIPRTHLTSKTREYRRTGAKFLKFEIKVPSIDIKKAALGKEQKLTEFEMFYANKMPKSWTNVPWVNFDGKIIEQNFTQTFEERLIYKDKDGNWVNNILQVAQKTEASWWDQIANKTGKINDIADATKARTAFAVNGNHSNDAVIVKRFHMWGKENKIPTSTVHDAFVTNAADMLKARQALREIYAEMLKKNVIKMTLDEMKARGLPDELYDQYLNEAIETGLIPVPGVSKINGKVLKLEDILTEEDILKEIPQDFFDDRGWYGVG